MVGPERVIENRSVSHGFLYIPCGQSRMMLVGHSPIFLILAEGRVSSLYQDLYPSVAICDNSPHSLSDGYKYSGADREYICEVGGGGQGEGSLILSEVKPSDLLSCYPERMLLASVALKKTVLLRR